MPINTLTKSSSNSLRNQSVSLLIWMDFVLKGLQWALCQFFGWCMEQEDCPDGICDEVMGEVRNLSVPDPTSPSPQSFAFDIQWDQLECLVTCTRELIACLRKFLGLDRSVGE